MIALIGREGVSSKKIWQNKRHNLSWEEVEIALSALLQQGRIVVSNRRFWKKG